MKLSIAFLFALGLFAQANRNPLPSGGPVANAAGEPVRVAQPNEKPTVNPDLFTLYESYGVKIEVIQRRQTEGAEQLKKNADLIIAQLQKEQEPARIRVCQAAALHDDCVVSQDPKTGTWSATAAPAVVAATPPAATKPEAGKTGNR